MKVSVYLKKDVEIHSICPADNEFFGGEYVYNANEGEDASIQNLQVKEIEISHSLDDNMNEREIDDYLEQIKNKIQPVKG